MNVRGLLITILVAASVVLASKAMGNTNIVAATESIKATGSKLVVRVGPEQLQTAPEGDREQWSLALLKLMGNDNPSYETMAFVVSWQGCENTQARFNPLATTEEMPGATDFNSVHVKNYQSYEDGLHATARTLANGRYPNVLTGLLTNDVGLAMNVDELDTWGTGLGCVQSAYNEFVPTVVAQGEPQQQVVVQQVVEPAQAQPQVQARASESLGYVLQGDVGVNVRAALNANGGALRHFTIQPGETWSFGHTIAPISAMGNLPVACGPAGCFEGAGWCDLSWMYMSIAQQLGMQVDFPQHIGVSKPFPGILLDENGNGGDLKITNTTDRPVTFTAIEQDGTLIVSAG